jgi:hypothetical protein
MEKTFKKLCTPARIYFAIAVIASIFALFRGISFGAVFVKMLFAFLWTYILGWLCKKGYSAISWFLVAFPYIVIALAALRIARIDQHRPIFRSLGIQGAYGEEAMSMPDEDGKMPSMPSMSKEDDKDDKNKKEGAKFKRTVT